MIRFAVISDPDLRMCSCYMLSTNQNARVRVLTGMVRVRCWVTHYVYESPHKDRRYKGACGVCVTMAPPSG